VNLVNWNWGAHSSNFGPIVRPSGGENTEMRRLRSHMLLQKRDDDMLTDRARNPGFSVASGGGEVGSKSDRRPKERCSCGGRDVA